MENSVREENTQIKNAYRTLLRACKSFVTADEKRNIRKAFNIALEAHRGVRRKSGELYIFHPLSVAIICAKDIGLGTTSIICALLHDVVEDTEVTLEEIEAIFGNKVARIIDGLTKISGFIDQTQSIQAENFKKILLTLADDVRVILIKLADRLHNMRTLDSMPKHTQLKIASETIELFAPLAHRLGLYMFKTEMEDLCFKYIEPSEYNKLNIELKGIKAQIKKFTKIFIKPIQQALDEQNFNYEIKSRIKSIYSIYKKMKFKNIPFDEVYDIFAIRIILDDSINEKADCWRIYSIVTDFYKPNQERLRDWLSTPKVNGYESLHTTVMGPTGKWVEVQIRTRRMDDIAEKGYAAHWKYKIDEPTDTHLDEWIKKAGELLKNTDESAIELFDEFKLNLFSHEVYVFTPKGKLVSLPRKATALDFAFEIHSDLGLQCLGVKVNNKLVPLSYELKNGDQVEIITSKKVKPSNEWLDYVFTAKARSKIKQTLNEEKRNKIKEGKELLLKALKLSHVTTWNKELRMLIDFFQLPSEFDLYYNIGINKITKEDINNSIRVLKLEQKAPSNETVLPKIKIETPDKNNSQEIIVGDSGDIQYSLAKCCNPIPGDEIFGFMTTGEGVIIHRINCPAGIRLMSNYGYRILEAKWFKAEIDNIEPFQVGVKFNGVDRLGIIGDLTNIIANQLKINIRLLQVKTKDGTFEGEFIADVLDTSHLENLIKRIKKIDGIETVTRFHVEENIDKS